MKSIRVLTALALFVCAAVSSAQTFSSSDRPVSIGPLTTNRIYTPASPYPSQIAVPASVAGTVTGISVRLRGLTADGDNGLGTQGLGILLVSPDGRQFELHRDTGNGGDALSNVTLHIADRNPNYMPDQSSSWPAATATINVKPTAYPDSSSPTNYVSPGPGIPAHSAHPAGSDTLASVFTGAIAAGAWKLFVVDHFQSDKVSFTGWDLILTVAANQAATSTTASSSANPSFAAGANSGVTLTASVSAAKGSPTGSIQFRDGVNAIRGCTASPLSSAISNTASATCSTTFVTEGDHPITAVYTGAGTFAGSTSATLHQYVRNHSTNPAPNKFCNAGPIAVPGQANTMPYPSVIEVVVVNTVATLTVSLNGLAAPNGTGGIKVLLVGPGGSKSLALFSAAGFSANQPPVNVTFSDNAASPAAKNGALSSGIYRPSTYDRPAIPSPPPPAPQVPAMLSISKTLAATFGGSAANGDWSLFVFNNSGSGLSASVLEGWCINITPGR
jgi:hypothetical protein